MKKAYLAIALALTSFVAAATDYYVVVPITGKKAPAVEVQLTLSGSILPDATVGTDYSYAFNQHLQVVGDASYMGTGVAWSVSAGNLPAGVALNPSTGVVLGQPTQEATSTFSLAASYKTKVSTQQYQLKTVDPASHDPYWANVTALWPLNGDLTAVTGPALSFMRQVVPSTSVAKFGTTSMYWPGYVAGVGDSYLTTTGGHAALAFGSGDFTVEGWFYSLSFSTSLQRYWQFTDDRDNVDCGLNGTASFYTGSADASTAAPAGTFKLNQWQHVALVRKNNVGTLYVNGTAVQTHPATNNSPMRGVFIGGGAYPFKGYIQGFRVTKGIARYVTNFSIPTKAFPTSN